MKSDVNKKKIIEDLDFRHYYKREPINVFLSALKNSGIMVGIMVAATLISFGLRELGIIEFNYIMTYILGVLLIADLTDGYRYGVIASVLGVLIFNFFFTEPYYTLIAYSPEYPITFVIMLIAALITSTLTARAKRDSRLAEMRENRMHILYQIERNLLAVKSTEQVSAIASKDISALFGVSVLVAISDIHGELSIRSIMGADAFNTDQEKTALMEAFQSGNACGACTQLFPDSRAYFQPVNGQSGVLGVIGMAFDDKYQLSESQKVFLDTISGQVALVLERERLYEKQQQVKMEMERERLRGDLLRAVSHDLRTPLTGILGSVSTIIENYEVLPEEVKKGFLRGIYEDAEWLNTLVENILSMTRFDEGRVNLRKEMEAVEELVAGAVSRIKKRSNHHELTVSIPDELIMIPADGTLIEQVLVNLLDNAIKHTPEDTIISVKVTRENDNVVFEVSDNGPGIPEKDLPIIFNRFVTLTNSVGRRGVGLGLAICKSIVEAHGGDILAMNNPSGGSVFRFTLPAKECV
jgi:two-component system, OmpR family, sensor histidine kinase KdpD